MTCLLSPRILSASLRAVLRRWERTPADLVLQTRKENTHLQENNNIVACETGVPLLFVKTIVTLTSGFCRAQWRGAGHCALLEFLANRSRILETTLWGGGGRVKQE